MNSCYSILICNPAYDIMDILPNAFGGLDPKPFLFLAYSEDWVCFETEKYPSSIQTIHIDFSQKNSCEKFFDSEIAKSGLFANIQYIFILAKNCPQPDVKTQNILDYFIFLHQEKKIFNQKPVIFCEVVDKLEYPSLKKKADGVFSKSSVLLTSMIFLGLLHSKKYESQKYAEMMEKSAIFLEEKNPFALSQQEQKNSRLFLLLLSLILLFALLGYILIHLSRV
ncbi:MAG: hypothetical protein HUU50_09580 [Candidatus Brocadiae bacterium]|nr:hypothetical protein [Candidatus Brocadiia bacterium]